MSQLSAEDYHVGWISALDFEFAAAQEMLDERHEITYRQRPNDDNIYIAGRIHTHNVMIACLPAGDDGLAAAAVVARDMIRTFTNLRFGLLVGIGGGIPDFEQGYDIRLGDVVVSKPDITYGACFSWY